MQHFLNAIMNLLNLKCCLLLLALSLGSMLKGVRSQGETELSESEKQDILDAHNRLRGEVNPTASNMQRMVRVKFSY